MYTCQELRNCFFLPISYSPLALFSFPFPKMFLLLIIINSMKNFEELLEEKLQDLYSAETQIIEALPRMKKAAESPELQSAFNNDLEETKKQIKRLEQVGALMNLEVVGKE